MNGGINIENIMIKLHFNQTILTGIVLFLVITSINQTNSFAQNKIDTLKIVKELRNEKKFSQALSMLKAYQHNHPKDLSTIWLHAETSFWVNNIKTAEDQYHNAINLYPDNLYLQFDYSKMLFYLGKFDEVMPILKRFLTYYPSNEEALMMKSRINYWQGNFDEASNTLQIILNKNPDNQDAEKLLREVRFVLSPWIKINSGFKSDDQPLKKVAASIEGGMYFNKLAITSFNFQSPLFVRKKKLFPADWFQVYNKSLFPNLGLNFIIGAGIVKFPIFKSTDWTGKAEADKILFKNLMIKFKYERLPYFYTQTSLNENIMTNQLSSTIGWYQPGNWNGEVSLSQELFPDNNSALTFYGWFLSPPLNFSSFELRAGYNFSYASSKESRFISKKSLSSIISNNEYDNPIQGFYNPYFTANDQQVHSALASLIFQPTENVKVGINTSISIYAMTLNPYFFLDKNSNGVLFINRNFAAQKFSPFQISAFALFNLNDKLNLKMEYQYQNLFFYKLHSIMIEFKNYFWNE